MSVGMCSCLQQSMDFSTSKRTLSDRSIQLAEIWMPLEPQFHGGNGAFAEVEDPARARPEIAPERELARFFS